MKIKPIIKTSENKNYLAEWIVEKFPENYQQMNYFEPFLGSGGVFLNKDPSVEETLNEIDESLVCIWRAIRDEPKNFCSKIRRIKYKESIFEKYKTKKNDKDYLNTAVADFVARNMSKCGQKKSFVPKQNKETNQASAEKIMMISERLRSVHILNKNALEIINAFSKSNCLMYCDPPSLDEKSSILDANKHVELGDLLKDFRGKVIISGQNTALYKRIYSSWNRKGVPNRPKESIWLNF